VDDVDLAIAQQLRRLRAAAMPRRCAAGFSIISRSASWNAPPRRRSAADTLDPQALADPHNRIWNWFGAVSWTREPYGPDAQLRVCRGFHAAHYFYLNMRSQRHEDIGWRPVLEEIDA